MPSTDLQFATLPQLPESGCFADLEERTAFEGVLAGRLRDVEMEARRCESELIAILDLAERSGVYGVDGHRTIRSWATATVNWSGPEAAADHAA